MFSNPFIGLSDRDLEKNLLGLAASERVANADIILHLMLVKERKLFAPAGFDSLFSYCVGKLGFSKSAAFRRKVVADKAADFPALLERIKDGRLQLCAAAAVAPYLAAGTAGKLLDAVVGMSYREVEAYLVKCWRAESASAGRALAATPAAAPQVALPFGSNAGTPPIVDSPTHAPGKPGPQRNVIKPAAAQANRVSVTLSDKTLASLKRAKEILGAHTDDEVLGKALEKLLDQLAPERRHQRREQHAARKAAKSEKPSTTKAAAKPEGSAEAEATPAKCAARSRRGRIADRDKAAATSNNQCTFISSDGRRCQARTHIEIDHIKPWALGGASTAANFRALCRTHNAYRAEQTFGAHRGSNAGPTRPRAAPPRFDRDLGRAKPL